MSLPLLAAKLIELRHQHGYSQQEVADYLDLTREGYSHYERNVREPNLETLVKLSRLYRVDIAELVSEETILFSESPVKKVPPAPNNPGLPKANTSSSPEALSITKNLNHLFKLLTGKNASLDLTTITKEDLTMLAQYKQLDTQTQQEVQDFIQFKNSRKKKE